MTVIIDGTNGVQSVGGSASTASFTKDGDTNNGIFFPATDVTAITTAGSERLRVDASGNLGIGTTSPSAKLEAYRSSIGEVARFTASSDGARSLKFISSDNTGSGAVWTRDIDSAYAQHRWAKSGTALMVLNEDGNLGIGTTSPSSRLHLKTSGATTATVEGVAFGSAITAVLQASDGNLGYVGTTTNHNFGILTNNTERARITAGGSLLVGTTTDSGKISVLQTASARAAYLAIDNASNTASVVRLDCSRNTTNSTWFFLECSIPGVESRCLIADSGNITNKNGSYGTISDAKMKTDIVDAGSQWDDIKAVRFRKFKMKNDESGLVQLGVVAQELEQTSPGLVDQHADRDEDGNDLGTTTKSVKTSVLLMKAAVALQEAMTRIEQLEAKVAALEAK